MLPVFAIAALLGRNEVLVCAVVAEAERQGLDPYIVCALVEVESVWKTEAKSNTGDYGLFQINRRYHGYYPDVYSHISKALGILRNNLVSSNGNVRWALAKYNAGSVSTRGKVYAAKVLTLAARLKAQVRGREWKQHRPSLLFSRVVCFWHLWCPEYAPRRRGKGRGRASA